MKSYKKYAPAVHRNKQAIYDVLSEHLPPRGNILEIASGSGEHCVYFAEQFPDLHFTPSDIGGDALQSIEAYRMDNKLKNVHPAMPLDMLDENWWTKAGGHNNFDAILCINMVHISPFQATTGLMAGACRCLKPGGILVLYGPYFENTIKTVPSNIEFDRSLREKNPDWGLRNLCDVVNLAETYSLKFTYKYQMPANNLTLIFYKA